MTSKIKVDNINKVSDDSNIIKKCGTTTTIGSGASNPIVVDGSAITLGRCGGTVALASGATQTGFGRTGTVDWQTTPKTGTFTAVSGEGYFANTTGSAFNMNLPAGVAGAIVSVADYAETFNSNNLTIVPNGTDKIGSLNNNATLETKGQSVTLVFVDSTQGWINTMDSTSNVRGAPPFICASVSGACNTLVTAPCCANAKIATFTGPGDFTVNNIASCAANNVVSYLIVAGGASGGAGSGGAWNAGGGGAGGFRESKSPVTPYTASPLISSTPVTVSAQTYAIVVGGGGAQQTNSAGGRGNVGGVSSFAGIVSAGGGGGGQGSNPTVPGAQGGSGGGAGSSCGGQPGFPAAGGAGNEPPVSPAQGNDGGAGSGSTGSCSAAGGGGAGGAGQNGPGGYRSGGVQVNSTITGTSKAYAQGGQSGDHPTSTPGAGGGPNPGGAGDNNTGGGGGGSPGANNPTSGAGGSGIVVIRYKFQ